MMITESVEKMPASYRDTKFEKGLGKDFHDWICSFRELSDARGCSPQTVIPTSNSRLKYQKYWNEFLFDDLNGSSHVNADNEAEHLKALQYRHEGGVKEILKSNVNLNDEIYRFGPLHRNLLHISVFLGDIRKTELLVKSGININSKDDNGWTALFMSINHPILFHDVQILELLIEAGADLNIYDNQRKTVFHRACLLYGQSFGLQRDATIINLLLQHGARVDCVDDKGQLAVEMIKKGPLRDEIIAIIFNFFHRQSPDRMKEYRNLIVNLTSKTFVNDLFQVVERACPICKRKMRICDKLKLSNRRYWLLVHQKAPK